MITAQEARNISDFGIEKAKKEQIELIYKTIRQYANLGTRSFYFTQNIAKANKELLISNGFILTYDRPTIISW